MNLAPWAVSGGRPRSRQGPSPPPFARFQILLHQSSQEQYLFPLLGNGGKVGPLRVVGSPAYLNVLRKKVHAG